MLDKRIDLKERVLFSPHASALGILLLLLLMPVGAIAQAESGSAAIEGMVTDATGAAVAGATVAVRNLETGLERVVTTDDGGRYSARVLPVGRYAVRVEARGFASGKQDQVILRVGEATPVSFNLQPATVTERVDIVADGQNIDGETQSTGIIISPRLVQDLPIRGRNFTEFASLICSQPRRRLQRTQFLTRDNVEPVQLISRGGPFETGCAPQLERERPLPYRFLSDTGFRNSRPFELISKLHGSRTRCLIA